MHITLFTKRKYGNPLNIQRVRQASKCHMRTPVSS